MQIRRNSVWDEAEIQAFLASQVIPLRVAVLTHDGTPLICSLWHEYRDGALWCATQQGASVVALLGDNPRCGFELAPETMPYRGVRGQGVATIHPDFGESQLRTLIERYTNDTRSKFARWLLSRADTEVAIRIDMDWITSWDFSTRMTG